jgi:hypothetical protein
MKRNAAYLAMAVLVFFLPELWSPVLLAQTYSPYQFLRLNTPARTAALGDATVASLEDTTFNALNPACAVTAVPGKVSATFIKHVLDISGGMASYTVQTADKAKVTVVASYMSLGSFEGKDNAGNSTGQTLHAGSLSFGALYARQIDSGFFGGVGLSLVSSQFPDAQTIAATLSGGVYYHIPQSRWNAGLSIMNLGTQLKRLGSTEESLPTDVRLGVSHRLRGLPLLFNFSFHHLVEKNVALFDGFKNFSLGGEFYVAKVIQLRVGYNNTLRASSSFPVSARLAGVSFGVGFVTKMITVDYAMTNMMSGVAIHRVSLQTALDSL